MTYDNVSNWLISNFGDQYQTILGLPILVFFVLSIAGRILGSKRELAKNGNSDKAVFQFLLGFISGLVIISSVVYLGQNFIDGNTKNRLQQLRDKIRI